MFHALTCASPSTGSCWAYMPRVIETCSRFFPQFWRQRTRSDMCQLRGMPKWAGQVVLLVLKTATAETALMIGILHTHLKDWWSSIFRKTPLLYYVNFPAKLPSLLSWLARYLPLKLISAPEQRFSTPGCSGELTGWAHDVCSVHPYYRAHKQPSWSFRRWTQHSNCSRIQELRNNIWQRESLV